MRKIVGLIIVVFSFTSCVIDSNESSTEFQVWNKSGYSPVVDFCFKSNTWKNMFDSSYINNQSIINYLKREEFHQNVSQIPLDWNYYWAVWLGDHDTFENAFNFYQTDTISVLFTTSIYNLRKWVSTHDDLYLIDMFPFSKVDLRINTNKYKLEYNPPVGCCVYVDNNNYEELYIGMFFYSTATEEELETGQTSVLSVIGEYKQGPQNNIKERKLKCPIGYTKASTFGDLFKKCETDEIHILIAESEDRLVEWQKNQNDSLLIKRYQFTLKQLGANNNSITIRIPEETGDL